MLKGKSFTFLFVLSLSISGHSMIRVESNEYLQTNLSCQINHEVVLPRHKDVREKPIVVAVIDSGVDQSHPCLKERFWKNPGESGMDKNGNPKESNGIDDDSNGYIDDSSGWDFVAQSHRLSDTNGHGTHIAGIILGQTPNAPGQMAGDQRVKILALKYYEPGKGVNNVRTTIEAIEYAIKMKVQIINYSSGGRTPSLKERNAINKAEKAGILFVTAAGNDSSDTDKNPFFPAGYKLPNMLRVGAIDRSNNRLPASNFGLKSVDIMAPGESIVSTLPGGGFGPMTGTSQATAFVSNAASQYLAATGKSVSPVEVVKRLLSSAKYRASLLGASKTAAELDIFRAIYQKGEREDALGVVVDDKSNLKQEVWLVN